MNRFVGNPFVWACCVAMTLWGNLSWAELSATADRRTIAMGETLRLTLLANYAVQLKIEAAKWVIGHRRPLRWQRVQAYWEVLKSGLKPR